MSSRVLRSDMLTEMSFGTASGTGLSTIAKELHLGTLEAAISFCLQIEDGNEYAPSRKHAAFYLYYSAALAMAENVYGRI